VTSITSYGKYARWHGTRNKRRPRRDTGVSNAIMSDDIVAHRSVGSIDMAANGAKKIR
jgi:hypothetical protein